MIRIGTIVHYVHNDKVEYKDEPYTVNNGGVIETRTRHVRVDNNHMDVELPFVVVDTHKLDDGTQVYDGWVFGKSTSEYKTNVLLGNPSTPDTIHEVD